MDDDDAEVRMAAVATTCALLKEDAQTHAGRSPHPDLPTVPRAWTRILNDALTKVLSLCIADTGTSPDPFVPLSSHRAQLQTIESADAR